MQSRSDSEQKRTRVVSLQVVESLIAASPCCRLALRADEAASCHSSAFIKPFLQQSLEQAAKQQPAHESWRVTWETEEKQRVNHCASGFSINTFPTWGSLESPSRCYLQPICLFSRAVVRPEVSAGVLCECWEAACSRLLRHNENSVIRFI